MLDMIRSSGYYVSYIVAHFHVQVCLMRLKNVMQYLQKCDWAMVLIKVDNSRDDVQKDSLFKEICCEALMKEAKVGLAALLQVSPKHSEISSYTCKHTGISWPLALCRTLSATCETRKTEAAVWLPTTPICCFFECTEHLPNCSTCFGNLLLSLVVAFATGSAACHSVQ